MLVPVLRQTAACCHGAAAFDKRRRWSSIARRRKSYPPLEGEGRREAAGWGDGLSFRTVPELRDCHPTPSHISLRSCEPTLPLQGRVNTISDAFTAFG